MAARENLLRSRSRFCSGAMSAFCTTAGSVACTAAAGAGAAALVASTASSMGRDGPPANAALANRIEHELRHASSLMGAPCLRGACEAVGDERAGDDGHPQR